MFNGKLKKENLRLKSELAAARENVLELSNKNDRLLLRQDTHDTEINNFKKRISELEKELREIKNTVREQTEADLLINALKAVGVIKEEKKYDYAKKQKELLALRDTALQRRSIPGAPLGAASLYSGLLGYNNF